MSDAQNTAKDAAYLLSAQAIRDRCGSVLALAMAGGTSFSVQMDRLSVTVEYVLDVIRDCYPTLAIPFHSRWGHFQAGGVNRTARLDRALADLDPLERARAKLDLVVVSVLLDAGAGPHWSYREEGTAFDRSEGLAVAGFHMFIEGLFSSDPDRPLRADAAALSALRLEDLARGFQISETNPLPGLEGRLALLRRLGQVMSRQASFFGSGRPGHLIDYLGEPRGKPVQAREILTAVLRGLGPIWPGRLQLGGIPLGDVWPHPGLGSPSDPTSWVPFHKLSQWLSYSLIEPMVAAGLRVEGVEHLTGLAEYRNGGLLIDMGLLVPRDPGILERPHPPRSEVIVSWRALTLVLLDLVAEEIRKRLNLSPEDFPLAKVLEGGTWRAGRRIAAAKRAGGGPPLQLVSDGTVF